MDHENSIVEEKPNSLFQVDRTFLKKILGRKSFHTENVVSVLQLGTPNHPQTEIIPPIKPPTAVHSQTFFKPSFASTHTTMSLFWKRSWKSHYQCKKTAKPKGGRGHFHGNNVTDRKGNNTPESVESADGNVESMC
ncbi:hypothetical protein CRYUN_Cryun11dG0047600 [Craigia yunnanensis]